MKRLLYIILVVLVAILCYCCRTTQYVPVETVRYDTTYVNKLKVDSIYDKEFVYVNGDTIFQYKYLYKYKMLRDTVYMSKVDSIQVPYPVERKLTRWEQFKINIGGYAVFAIVVTILIVFGRLIYKLKK